MSKKSIKPIADQLHKAMAADILAAKRILEGLMTFHEQGIVPVLAKAFLEGNAGFRMLGGTLGATDADSLFRTLVLDHGYQVQDAQAAYEAAMLYLTSGMISSLAPSGVTLDDLK